MLQTPLLTIYHALPLSRLHSLTLTPHHTPTLSLSLLLPLYISLYLWRSPHMVTWNRPLEHASGDTTLSPSLPSCPSPGLSSSRLPPIIYSYLTERCLGTNCFGILKAMWPPPRLPLVSLGVLLSSLSLALSLSLSWPSHPICPLYTKTLLVIEKQRGLLKEEEWRIGVHFESDERENKKTNFKSIS